MNDNLTNKTSWNIPVPKALDDAVEEVVKHESYSSKSEFVRSAVRFQLKKLGYSQPKFAYSAKEVL